jgi:hypothetical protein
MSTAKTLAVIAAELRRLAPAVAEESRGQRDAEYCELVAGDLERIILRLPSDTDPADDLRLFG